MPSNRINTLEPDRVSAVDEILSIQSPPHYLAEGQLCVIYSAFKQKTLSKTGEVVQIYQSSPQHQILICSPLNTTFDEQMISSQKLIPESNMFRVNAAFGEINVVPTDILLSLDASDGTEPETIIALANFADENTAVIVTGSPRNTPYLVRSDTARRRGLKISYFERLRKQALSD
ncbi:hypothetical protein TorRG33x02_130440 [Trema orientale]|uniref:P-loop containing nucleoside triphosphate hydrolase n=1 Tax=Trema orientale TaxID=63057 RepID=A0A2P5F0B8_TREOI|nr:hypothetical protein TorRG33x02_130440 [Trema orientale]